MSGIVCCKWCRESESETHLCLFTNLDIHKAIFIVQISFWMTKYESDVLILDLHIQKAKFFKSLRIKGTFHVSVLGANLN